MNRTVFKCDSKYVTCIHQKCPFRFTLTYYGVLNEKIAASTNNAPSRKPQKTRVRLRFYYLQDTYSNTLKWKNKNTRVLMSSFRLMRQIFEDFLQRGFRKTESKLFPLQSICANIAAIYEWESQLSISLCSPVIQKTAHPRTFWTNGTFIPVRIYLQFFGQLESKSELHSN
jgi:hypothetical protein